ncbi:MAG: pyridoxamine 5'-phosphate oxidase family protein, partial [Planctomycetota bacterium]
MSLSSSLDSVIAAAGALDKLDPWVWQTITAGAASARHPFHVGAFVSGTFISNEHGDPPGTTPVQPTACMVVLRRSDRETRSLDLFTDRRSQKAKHVESNSVGQWLFWDRGSRVQFRISGSCHLITSGDEIESVWQSIPVPQRSDYLSQSPPGSKWSGPKPPNQNEIASIDTSDGRYFGILRLRAQHVDVLYLRRDGHVRAGLQYA